MEDQPWRRPLVIAVTIVIGTSCLVLGYALGHKRVIADRITQSELTRDLQAAQTRLNAAEAELVDARLNAEVHKNATDALREDLTSAHSKSARLQEEVTFYKGLMAPSSLASGLQVAELDLVPTEDGAYTYQLLLTQVALRRSFIAGEVRLDVIGAYADPDVLDEAVLSLTELSETKAYPLKFRFRYFQDLTGRITLPPGYTPARVLVTVNQNGKEPLQVTFPWPSA